eukprot:TRINITY_DN60538_c0_g1_i1.p1 TRINITY_DN60538_c0_g1~~TRINITY_DN60538_c0_g1_i1.p1  ORF type:complete len:191 (+),score=37.16 TRINITY_DN60538_c0_g1_i1:67-639(+)
MICLLHFFFFFNDTATTEIYTRSIVGSVRCVQETVSVLQELYAEIEDIAMKAYSGINEQELFNYKTLDLSGISEQDITLAEINFVFSDSNKEQVNNVLDRLEKRGLDRERDAVVVGDIDRFIQVMTDVKNRVDVKNRSVALLAMCRICEQFLDATDTGDATEQKRQIQHQIKKGDRKWQLAGRNSRKQTC